MKNLVTYILLLFIGLTVSVAQAQVAGTTTEKKVYTTSGGEMIFSWADATQNGATVQTITRFSAVVCAQIQLNMDMNKHIGFFTGFNIRNVGFIWDDPNESSRRYKARTYNAGVPVAIKLGNMSKYFLFGGYEFELPFNYKEKVFVNEDKQDKTSSWFSGKTPVFYNAVFAGFQTPYGTQLKFKYYLTNFFNQDYEANIDGVTVKPYDGFEANVFYLSLSFQILHGTKVAYKKK